jgi:hypothetical protein
MTPVFIFSTPRAGSTLLQRMLACHQKIATVAEPWVLLPLLSMTQTTDTNDNPKECQSSFANYSSTTCTKAISSFTQNITSKAKVNQNDNYHDILSEFVLSLYRASAENNEEFFVDKTPRYYYIINEIVKLFPNAKFIFLFRNPLQTYASVLDTWNNNSFHKLYRNRDDLYLAPKLLSSAYKQYKNISLAVNYDNLVTQTSDTMKNIFDYLDIDHLSLNELDIEKNTFNPNEMGDTTGQKKYKKVSDNSLYNWHNSFNNPIRKWYLKRYLKHLGTHVEKYYGYSTLKLTQDLDLIPSVISFRLVKDIAGIIYQKLVYKLKLNILLSSKYRKNLKGFYD